MLGARKHVALGTPLQVFQKFLVATAPSTGIDLSHVNADPSSVRLRILSAGERFLRPDIKVSPPSRNGQWRSVLLGTLLRLCVAETSKEQLLMVSQAAGFSPNRMTPPESIRL